VYLLTCDAGDCLTREAIRQRGDFVGAYRVLTAAAGADQMPIKLDADREHYLEAFRRAGLD